MPASDKLSKNRPKGMNNPKIPQKSKKPSIVIAIGVGKPKNVTNMKNESKKNNK